MSLSSSMNASVAGLSANSVQLASISDNIANASTYGYKRVETEFDAMVIGEAAATYTAGGVATNNIHLFQRYRPCGPGRRDAANDDDGTGGIGRSQS